jgi:hypothetical protein
MLLLVGSDPCWADIRPVQTTSNASSRKGEREGRLGWRSGKRPVSIFPYDMAYAKVQQIFEQGLRGPPVECTVAAQVLASHIATPALYVFPLRTLTD